MSTLCSVDIPHLHEPWLGMTAETRAAVTRWLRVLAVQAVNVRTVACGQAAQQQQPPPFVAACDGSLACLLLAARTMSATEVLGEYEVTLAKVEASVQPPPPPLPPQQGDAESAEPTSAVPSAQPVALHEDVTKALVTLLLHLKQVVDAVLAGARDAAASKAATLHCLQPLSRALLEVACAAITGTWVFGSRCCVEW